MKPSPHQFEQLPLFMNADEVMSQVEFGDSSAGESKEDILKYKLREAKAEDIYDSVRKEGVHTPISILAGTGYKELLDGHHRLAVSHDIDPKAYFPVTHQEEPSWWVRKSGHEGTENTETQ